MIIFNKKKIAVRNKSYKYGMLGEIYVHKNVKCPRCGARLGRNPPCTPGTDFKCRRGHWFQLKTRNFRNFYEKKIVRLLGGSYKHQTDAVVKKKSDILILFYEGRKVQILYWLKNERINVDWITPWKKVKKGKTYTGSIIKCQIEDLLQINIEVKGFFKHKLRNNGKKRMRKICFDGKESGSGLDEEINCFLRNDNTRRIVKDNCKNKYYFVDITEGTCNCSNNDKKYCEHLQYFMKEKKRKLEHLEEIKSLGVGYSKVTC